MHVCMYVGRQVCMFVCMYVWPIWFATYGRWPSPAVRMIMEGQNQAERESVYAKVKFEDSNLYKTLLVNRNLCTCIVLQRSNWQVTNYWIPCLAHHAQTFHIEFVHTKQRSKRVRLQTFHIRVRSHRVSFKTSLITPKSVIS